MIALALLLLTASGGPVGAEQPLAVRAAELSRRLDELDGRLVMVRGWLTCGDWGCDLRARPAPDHPIAPRPPSVAIGHDERLGSAIADAAGREVVIEGRVTTMCRREICLDHAPELMPIRLLRVVGLPAATKDQ